MNIRIVVLLITCIALPTLTQAADKNAAQDKAAIGKQLDELLNQPVIARWFTPDWKVKTEVPILLPGGGESRIDRLMINGTKAIVVDFKTGEKEPACNRKPDACSAYR